MENEIKDYLEEFCHLENFVEKNQEKICKLCENNIIGGSSVTQFYMCEGSYCDEALQIYLEELDEDDNKMLINYGLVYNSERKKVIIKPFEKKKIRYVARFRNL